MNTTVDVSELLRDAIAASGKAPYRIGMEAGVDPHAVARFARGEAGLTLRNAGKIMAILGLEVRPRK